jgi:hypothetical protein
MPHPLIGKRLALRCMSFQPNGWRCDACLFSLIETELRERGTSCFLRAKRALVPVENLPRRPEARKTRVVRFPARDSSSHSNDLVPPETHASDLRMESVICAGFSDCTVLKPWKPPRRFHEELQELTTVL